jgi:hypothetical protein
MGLIILIRVYLTYIYSQNNKTNTGFFNKKPQMSKLNYAKRNFFILLSFMIILTGIISLFLDRNWFLNLNYIYKIPIYTLLGISISFTLSFMIIDIINYICMNCRKESYHSKPVINNSNQVYIYIL